MIKKFGASIFLTFVFSSNQVAFADDGDVSVVGPSGKSSVAIGLNNSHYNADEFVKNTAIQGGQVSESGSALLFSGIYAVNDLVSVSATVPWNFSGDNTLTWFDTTSHYSDKITERNVNVAGIVINNNADQGFKLVAGSGADWLASANATYYGYLQPQYRINSTLLTVSTLTIGHQQSAENSQAASFGLVWAINPAWTVNPSIGYNHFEKTDATSSHSDRNAGIGATYHISKKWALSANTGLTRASALTFTNYVNEAENGKSYYINVAIRSYFD